MKKSYPKYEPGQRFGEWTVMEKTSKRKVLCKCSCGTQKELYRTNLGSGKSKSCGCSRKTGTEGTKLYNVWASMKSRCANKNHRFYESYGGRGIAVCKEWEGDVKTFYDWALSSGYKEGLSLDRVDNNGNYEPNNCRWATRLEQHNNKRNNLLITLNGRTCTVAEWARKTGINNRTILSRLRDGWEPEVALERSVAR